MPSPHYDPKRPICPHCNLKVALGHNGRCTSNGCGKSLSAPVRLFAHVKEPPVRRIPRFGEQY